MKTKSVFCHVMATQLQFRRDQGQERPDIFCRSFDFLLDDCQWHEKKKGASEADCLALGLEQKDYNELMA